VFLHRLKSSAVGVSVAVKLSRMPHLKSTPKFRVLKSPPFGIVHPCLSFAFLRQLKSFAVNVFVSVRLFRVLHSKSVEVICRECFGHCKALWNLTFEINSKVSRFEEWAFCSCSSLSTICIPASVEVICRECFVSCEAFSSVIFEVGCKLSRIQRSAFAKCSSLSSICVPSTVEVLCTECTVVSVPVAKSVGGEEDGL
jgi:hypothetical protein